MFSDLTIDRVFPNPDQPRTEFVESHISELAASIEENGLLQPIRVTARDDGFMIIAGECRWRAHKLLGRQTISAEVVTASDADVSVAAIVENLQRRDISPMEEAAAFAAAMAKHGWDEVELAKRLGIRQPWRIAERTALLRLRPDFQELLRKGHLTPTQAYEMTKLSVHGQQALFKAIRSGACETNARLKAVASGILEAEQQMEMFEVAPKPTAEEMAKLSRLESLVSKVCGILAGGFDDGAVVIAKKVTPDRARTMADELRLIQKHLAQLESALVSASTHGLLN